MCQPTICTKCFKYKDKYYLQEGIILDQLNFGWGNNHGGLC